MNLTAVQSSQINAIGYDPNTQKMRIEFKPGSLYEYSNIPPEVFEEFAKAKSVGSHFYKHIKPHPDKYPYVKLVDADGNAVVQPATAEEPKPDGGGDTTAATQEAPTNETTEA